MWRYSHSSTFNLTIVTFLHEKILSNHGLGLEWVPFFINTPLRLKQFWASKAAKNHSRAGGSKLDLLTWSVLARLNRASDLRVFACNSQTYCRRPDSDSDKTRSRRSSGPKTKLETPLSTIRAHTWCPGASKVADFGRPKKPFFGQIFFLSNRTQMFAMPFS